MGYTRKTPNRGGLDIYTFLNPPPPEFFKFFNLLIVNKLLRLQILQNFVTTLHGFHLIFLATFPHSPWLFGTQVPWISLTSTRNKLQGSIIPKPKSKEFKWDSRRKLHNCKILLVMYVYHKATFTFEVSFSTSTYDVRWMCFNVKHILMNIVGTIYLNTSLQTFSITIVWQCKTVKDILVLYTI